MTSLRCSKHVKLLQRPLHSRKLVSHQNYQSVKKAFQEYVKTDVDKTHQEENREPIVNRVRLPMSSVSQRKKKTAKSYMTIHCHTGTKSQDFYVENPSACEHISELEFERSILQENKGIANGLSP